MGRYKVTHQCGHIEDVQLYGSYVERERRIKWLESQDCPECRKAKGDACAEDARRKRGLSELNGSEKQVAWANSIRESVYKCLDTVESLANGSNTEQARIMVDGWREKMDSINSAKWWIDNRYSLPTDSHPDAAKTIIKMFVDVFGK